MTESALQEMSTPLAFFRLAHVWVVTEQSSVSEIGCNCSPRSILCTLYTRSSVRYPYTWQHGFNSLAAIFPEVSELSVACELPSVRER